MSPPRRPALQDPPGPPGVGFVAAVGALATAVVLVVDGTASAVAATAPRWRPSAS